MQSTLQKAINGLTGAFLFAYLVNDPERYGVVEFGGDGKVVSIEEKPKNPKSKYAVSGLYLYDNEVIEVAKSIKPSKRGELEITSINNYYLDKQNLQIETFGRGMTWLDTGTPESLMEAGEFVKVIQKRQGLIISCPEEIAWRNGWIDSEKLIILADSYVNSYYKNYLLSLIN